MLRLHAKRVPIVDRIVIVVFGYLRGPTGSVQPFLRRGEGSASGGTIPGLADGGDRGVAGSFARRFGATSNMKMIK